MEAMNITILGATGSIGTQTLEVVRNLRHIKVKCLSTNKNTALLKEQILEFHPEAVCITDEQAYDQFRREAVSKNTKVLYGLEGLVQIACEPSVQLVVNAVVGNIGLLPTIKAIEAGKNIALANKETLVSGGQLVMDKVRDHGVAMYPVDSEHSAIFQCLQGNQHNKIHKILLTASGGPFRTLDQDKFGEIRLADALKHPNWHMGPKITIDSATLMNKGLEVIEAKWLFDVSLEHIEVLIHPQSIVHSMVEFEDGAVMAQLGAPDMKVPIAYALNYPNRVQGSFERINFFERNTLTFEKPRVEVFPCLNLAMEAIRIGGSMPAVLNAANEGAVNMFLSEKISFTQIPVLIEQVMHAYTVKQDYSLDDILAADQWARQFIDEVV